jgi:hypothetical protein
MERHEVQKMIEANRGPHPSTFAAFMILAGGILFCFFNVPEKIGAKIDEYNKLRADVAHLMILSTQPSTRP